MIKEIIFFVLFSAFFIIIFMQLFICGMCPIINFECPRGSELGPPENYKVHDLCIIECARQTCVPKDPS